MNKFDKEGLTSNKVISDVIITSDGQLYLTSDAADSRYMPIDAEVGGSFSPKDFKKLCRRMELPDDENWILWTDEGNIAYMNFNDKIVDGIELFRFKTGITIFDFDLPNLTNGYAMFYGCSNLTSFTSDLSSLTNGYHMFLNCSNLTSFTSDLSSLTNGEAMFSNTPLTTFSGDLSSLTNGEYMFQRCTNLTSFSSDLSSLTSGFYMFYNTPLTTFSGDLSSLTGGSSMFYGCKLNKESVINIINCLKNSNTCSVAATLTLGIDASLKTDTELQTLLGITEGATSATLVGHGGGTWSITIGWN